MVAKLDYQQPKSGSPNKFQVAWRYRCNMHITFRICIRISYDNKYEYKYAIKFPSGKRTRKVVNAHGVTHVH